MQTEQKSLYLKPVGVDPLQVNMFKVGIDIGSRQTSHVDLLSASTFSCKSETDVLYGLQNGTQF